MNYLKLLNDGYVMTRKIIECPPKNHLDYLGDYIFDFTTYDNEMSILFASKAIEVCEAINNRTTFEYIKNKEKYKWFLLICNMPFFISKLEWGTSIRGAWWDFDIKFNGYGLWNGDKQMEKMQFNQAEWMEFISAVIAFGKE